MLTNITNEYFDRSVCRIFWGKPSFCCEGGRQKTLRINPGRHKESTRQQNRGPNGQNDNEN